MIAACAKAPHCIVDGRWAMFSLLSGRRLITVFTEWEGNVAARLSVILWHLRWFRLTVINPHFVVNKSSKWRRGGISLSLLTIFAGCLTDSVLYILFYNYWLYRQCISIQWSQNMTVCNSIMYMYAVILCNYWKTLNFHLPLYFTNFATSANSQK